LLLLIDVALALLGRIQQQLQLLSLAFPAKMLATLAILAALAPTTARIFEGAAGRNHRRALAQPRVLIGYGRQRPAYRKTYTAAPGARAPGRRLPFEPRVSFRCPVRGLRVVAGRLRESMAGPHRPLHARPVRARLLGELNPASLATLVRGAILPELVPLVLAAATLVVLAVFTQLATTRMGISAAKLAPDFKRLNFFARMKNIPGQNLPLFFQALLLLPVVGLVVYYEAVENLNSFLALPWLSAKRR